MSAPAVVIKPAEGKIAVSIGTTLWVRFTAQQARELAVQLLTHATALERLPTLHKDFEVAS